MVVVFDNNILSLLLNPETSAPVDPETRAPIHRVRERIDLLIKTLAADKARIIIPAPVLAEFRTVAPTSFVPVIETSRSTPCGG